MAVGELAGGGVCGELERCRELGRETETQRDRER